MGKIGAIIFILLSWLNSDGQKIVDTIGLYNGETTKKRIEYSRSGEIEKETYYYPNGGIEEQNLYNKGVSYYWISYDRNGKQTAEWGDRANGLEKWKKQRQWLLSLTILSFAVLTLVAARRHFEKTFYIFLTMALFAPFLVMMLERRASAPDAHRNFDLIFSSMLYLIPAALLILSLTSLFRGSKKIPLLISLLTLVISVIYLLFLSFISNIAGAGIVG